MRETCLEIATVLQSMQEAEQYLVHEPARRVRGAQHSARSVAGIPLHLDIAAAQCCAQCCKSLLHPCWPGLLSIAGAAAQEAV